MSLPSLSKAHIRSWLSWLLLAVAMLPATTLAQEASTAHLEVPENEVQYMLDRACDDCGLNECGCGPATWPRFGMYFKGGPSFQMGQSLFEEKTQVGYEIAFGGREPLLPTEPKVFFDFGGSYLSAFGEGRTQTVSGTFNGVTFLRDFFNMSLEEISRTSIHSGIGWYHELSDNPQISRVFTFRGGGRLAHVRGHFRQDPTEALQDLIDNATGQFTLAKSQIISQTDVAPGVFLGFELYSARYISQGATIALVVDSEFEADWIKFEGYERGTLVTANVLFGLTVNR